MSPKEASEILDEPDWAAQFANSGGSEIAFENILTAWRKWHWTPVVVEVGRTKHGEAITETKKQLAPSVKGVIALALLGIMPPRTLWPDRLPGPYEEQVDDMCWFVSEGRAWRILGIEDKMLCLNSFGDEKQIDLTRAKWKNYCSHHAAILEAMQK